MNAVWPWLPWQAQPALGLCPPHAGFPLGCDLDVWVSSSALDRGCPGQGLDLSNALGKFVEGTNDPKFLVGPRRDFRTPVGIRGTGLGSSLSVSLMPMGA